MSTPAAEFNRIIKRYTSGFLGRHVVHAVRDVSLRVEQGEVFGLLGPNRAGKTTLVKILLSLCQASSGTVTRFGKPLSDRSTLGRIGYMHENHAFPRYLNATELLHFYGALALIPGAKLEERVPALLQRVGLADRAHEPIAHFSKGMVQRLGLAQALINEPDLLVLDEPTEGLDLPGRRLLREVIDEMRQGGRSVLLVSHVIPEVEKLCDRVAVLVEGKLVHVGPTRELAEDRPLESSLFELYAKGAAS